MGKSKNIEIPAEVVEKWQNIVDIMAKITDVPAGLIMEVDRPYIKVFRASNTEENPYKKGEREKLTGLYCEEVITSREKLLVPNALKNERWKENPDIELGMISYLGFPIEWPNGEIFGTICVLDSRERKYSEEYQKLVFHFKEVVESHLKLLYQRKQLEKENVEREEMEQLYKSLSEFNEELLEHAPIGIMRLNAEMEIEYANPEMQRILGLPFGKEYDASWEKIQESPFIEETEISSEVFDALKNEERVSKELSFALSSGEKGCLNLKGVPLVEEGEFIGAVLLFNDITKRKKMEKELQESKKKFETLFHTAKDAIFIHDLKGNFLEVNEETCERLGYSREELLEMTPMEVDAPEYASEVHNKIQKLQEEGEAFLETAHVTKEGKRIPTELSSKIIEYEGKKAILSIARDITKRKEMEEKLSAIYELSKEMSLSMDREHIIDTVLDTAEKNLNFDNIDLFLVDRKTNTLEIEDTRGKKNPERWTVIPLYGEKSIAAHVARTGESLLIPDVRKDDRYIIGLKAARSELCVPIKVKNEIIGVLDVESTKIDVFSEEDKKLLETLASHAAVALKNARLFEETENQRKELSEFAHTVSHDLKNYIGTIKNRAQLSLMKEKTAKNNAEKIIKITEKMEKFVKKQLKLADAGKIIGEPEEIDLNELVEGLKKQHDIEIKRGDLPIIRGDPQRLKEVFHNLIENAIIHGDATHIDVTSERKDNVYIISVKDNGRGIVEENIGKIFEKGYSSGDGTGIGLTIVKKIVEAHGGSILVESEEGKETTFKLLLPK